MSLFVKKGDTVLMIAGKDKGKTGKVTSCDPKSGRVVVEGCNIITKHQKPRRAGETGGINKLAGPVDASNVQVICPSCNKATRVKHSVEGENKIRVCGKCGASLEPKKEAPKKQTRKSKADKSEAAEKVAEEVKETKKPAKKAPAKSAKKTAEATTEAPDAPVGDAE